MGGIPEGWLESERLLQAKGPFRGDGLGLWKTDVRNLTRAGGL